MCTKKLVFKIYVLIMFSMHSSVAQSDNEFVFNVRQIIFDDHDDIYSLNGRTLSVHSSVKKNCFFKKDFDYVYIKQFKTKISKEDFDTIKMSSEKLLSFDSLYVKSVLGGFSTTIDFTVNQQSKKIILKTYTLDETSKIFSILNKYANRKKFCLLKRKNKFVKLIEEW